MLVADHHTLDQLQDLGRGHPPEATPGSASRPSSSPSRDGPPRTSPTPWAARSRPVKNWVAQYNRGGIEALRERPRHRTAAAAWTRSTTPGSSSGSTPRPRPRTASAPSGPPTSGGSSSSEFGVLMGRQAVYDLLHRLGYSDLMPRPQHEDANPEVQEFFKEIVVEQIDAIAAEHPDKEVRVYFEDEARFGTQGTITRVWARKGSRPRAVRQNGREWLYVLMAVCAGTGAASALIMPELNTAVVNLFLEQFSRELPGRGPRGADLGRGGLPHRRGPGGAGQREPDPAAAVLAGAEPGGEPVALPAVASLVQSGVRGLRGPPERKRSGASCAVCQDAEKLKTICNADYVNEGHKLSGKRIRPGAPSA